jgi:hypothetical protein
MTPIFTSVACARAAIGPSAAAAVAPSRIFRRVMLITRSSYQMAHIDEAIDVVGKASRSGRNCS